MYIVVTCSLSTELIWYCWENRKQRIQNRVRTGWPHRTWCSMQPTEVATHQEASAGPINVLRAVKTIDTYVPTLLLWAALVTRQQKNHLPVQEMWVLTGGWKDPLEKEIATHSSVLAWDIPRTEEPSGLQSMRSQRVGHNSATKHHHHSR